MLWLLVAGAGLVASLGILHWLVSHAEDMNVYRRIPGPYGLPIIGNTFDIFTDRVKIFGISRKWASDFKDLYSVYIPPFKTVSIYNPEDIETVLSTPRFNEKSFIYTFLKPWLQEGLLLSSGAKWHSRRKILTPAFHFNILRHFSHILEENSWRMVLDLEGKPEGEKTDLIPLISAFTLHSICETAMGTKLDEEKSGAGLKYKKAIHEIGALLVQRLTRAWLLNDVIFKLSSTGRKQNRVLETIKAFPKHVINERRKYREQFGDDLRMEGAEQDDELTMGKSKKRMAMLDLLLTAEKQGLIDADGIQEEVDTFMFEGHDTTAMGLVFTLMLLANHKDVQDKIVKECEGIFGVSDRPATMSDLTEMKYLECCVKEGLRLYPPVPFISRRIGEQVQLKDYLVPAGALCHVQIFDLHRRADLFHEPLQFRPDRFLSDRGDSRHPYAYIPFSAGPRNCIGQKFALLEMKSAISAILRTYELQPVTKPEDIVFSADLVLRSHNPVYVKFVKRK